MALSPLTRIAASAACRYCGSGTLVVLGSGARECEGCGADALAADSEWCPECGNLVAAHNGGRECAPVPA